MKRRAVLIFAALTVFLVGCGSTATEDQTQTEEVTEEVVEEVTQEVVVEPEPVTIVGTEYVYAENDTHTLVTTYSDDSTETGDVESCDYGETGTCSVCGHVYEIPEPVVTAFEEPADYVATAVVNTYAADCKYAELTGEIGTADVPTIVKVTGTTANEWYQLEDGTFVKLEDLTERTAYEEVNGKIYTVTYFDEPKTLYCQESSNIRILPEDDAEVSYKKSTNDEVTVLGTCNEAKWYYLEDGTWTLQSNLGEDKVVVYVTPDLCEEWIYTYMKDLENGGSTNDYIEVIKLSDNTTWTKWPYQYNPKGWVISRDLDAWVCMDNPNAVWKIHDKEICTDGSCLYSVIIHYANGGYEHQWVNESF